MLLPQKMQKKATQTKIFATISTSGANRIAEVEQIDASAYKKAFCIAWPDSKHNFYESSRRPEKPL